MTYPRLKRLVVATTALASRKAFLHGHSRRSTNRYFAWSLVLAVSLAIAQRSARADQVCIGSDTSSGSCQTLTIADPFPIGGSQSSSFSLATADGQFTAVGTYTASSSGATGGLAGGVLGINASIGMTVTVTDVTGAAESAYLNEFPGVNFSLPFSNSVGSPQFFGGDATLIGTCNAAAGSNVNAGFGIVDPEIPPGLHGVCPSFSDTESGSVLNIIGDGGPANATYDAINLFFGVAFNFNAGPAGQSISLPLNGETFVPSPVPDPPTLALFGTGLLGLLGLTGILRRKLVW